MEVKKHRDSKMELILHDAVSKNDIAQVKFYVKFQPSNSQINRPSPDDSLTPLLRACKHGHIEIARILLDHGAMVEDRDEHGNTCLHYAARDNNSELVQLLLNCCARTFVKNNKGQLPIDISDGGSCQLISDKMVKDGRHEFVGVCKMLNLTSSRLVMTSYNQINVKPNIDTNKFIVHNERKLSDGQLLNWKRATHCDLQGSFLLNKETSVASDSFHPGLFQVVVGNPQKPFTNSNLNNPERQEDHKFPNSGFAHDVQPINGVIKPTNYTDQTNSHLKGNVSHSRSSNVNEPVGNNLEGKMKVKHALSCPAKYSLSSKACHEAKEYNTSNGHSFQRSSSYNSSKLQNGLDNRPPSLPTRDPSKPYNSSKLQNGLDNRPPSLPTRDPSKPNQFDTTLSGGPDKTGLSVQRTSIDTHSQNGLSGKAQPPAHQYVSSKPKEFDTTRTSISKTLNIEYSFQRRSDIGSCSQNGLDKDNQSPPKVPSKTRKPLPPPKPIGLKSTLNPS